MRRHILRNHINAHGSYRVGNLVLDKRVNMIWSCRQQNNHPACRTRLLQYLHVPSLQRIQIILLCGNCLSDCMLGSRLVDT